MTDDAESHEWTWADVLELREMREYQTLALRVSATTAGNPARCRMKACRKTGRCHLTMTPEDDGGCHAGVTHEMIERASLMIVFLVQFARTCVARQPWSTWSHDRRWAATPPKRKRRKKQAASPDMEDDRPRIGRT